MRTRIGALRVGTNECAYEFVCEVEARECVRMMWTRMSAGMRALAKIECVHKSELSQMPAGRLDSHVKVHEWCAPKRVRARLGVP